MKLVDAILILAILGIGAAFFLMNRGGNCRNGQIQLTGEVKAMIDRELATALPAGGEGGGVRELMAQISAVEQSFNEVQALGKEYLKVYIAQATAIRSLDFRKRNSAKELKQYIENLEKQVVGACSRRKAGKI